MSRLPPIGVKLILNGNFESIPNLWAPRLGKDGFWLKQVAEDMVATALEIKPQRVRVTNELRATKEIMLNIITPNDDEDQRTPMQLGAMLISKIQDKNDPIQTSMIAPHIVEAEFHEKAFPDVKPRTGNLRSESWSGGVCVFAAPGENGAAITVENTAIYSMNLPSHELALRKVSEEMSWEMSSASEYSNTCSSGQSSRVSSLTSNGKVPEKRVSGTPSKARAWNSGVDETPCLSRDNSGIVTTCANSSGPKVPAGITNAPREVAASIAELKAKLEGVPKASMAPSVHSANAVRQLCAPQLESNNFTPRKISPPSSIPLPSMNDSEDAPVPDSPLSRTTSHSYSDSRTSRDWGEDPFRAGRKVSQGSARTSGTEDFEDEDEAESLLAAMALRTNGCKQYEPASFDAKLSAWQGLGAQPRKPPARAQSCEEMGPLVEMIGAGASNLAASGKLNLITVDPLSRNTSGSSATSNQAAATEDAVVPGGPFKAQSPWAPLSSVQSESGSQCSRKSTARRSEVSGTSAAADGPAPARRTESDTDSGLTVLESNLSGLESNISGLDSASQVAQAVLEERYQGALNELVEENLALRQRLALMESSRAGSALPEAKPPQPPPSAASRAALHGRAFSPSPAAPLSHASPDAGLVLCDLVRGSPAPAPAPATPHAPAALDAASLPHLRLVASPAAALLESNPAAAHRALVSGDHGPRAATPGSPGALRRSNLDEQPQTLQDDLAPRAGCFAGATPMRRRQSSGAQPAKKGSWVGRLFSFKCVGEAQGVAMMR